MLVHDLCTAFKHVNEKYAKWSSMGIYQIQANWNVFHLYSNKTDVKYIINVLYQSPELVIEAINIPENRFVIHVPDQRQESANKNTKPGKTQRTSDEH